MKIKICGIFRNEDIDYINEARPDYTGFVFAKSRREVSFTQAARLRERLAEGIAAAGVFVNAPIENINAVYRDGVISIAQLHGDEDEAYIARLKEENHGLQVIKAVQMTENPDALQNMPLNADYYLIDSGAGSGKTFNWNILLPGGICDSLLKSSGKPWFLAGGINEHNIEPAMALKPFCIDVSGGAETNGIKDWKKIVQLTAIVRKGNTE